jgi:hypothetical protein
MSDCRREVGHTSWSFGCKEKRDAVKRGTSPPVAQISRLSEGGASHDMTTEKVDVKGKKSIAPGSIPAPRWCPAGLTPTQCRRVQKLWAK